MGDTPRIEVAVLNAATLAVLRYVLFSGVLFFLGCCSWGAAALRGTSLGHAGQPASIGFSSFLSKPLFFWPVMCCTAVLSGASQGLVRKLTGSTLACWFSTLNVLAGPCCAVPCCAVMLRCLGHPLDWYTNPRAWVVPNGF